MRAFLFLGLVFQLIFGGITSGSNAEQLQDIKLIRRAYIDVCGLVPTIKEMDWFIVYNRDGYVLAVDYLLKTYPTALDKEYLLSNEYKTQPSSKLSQATLTKVLFYVTGMSRIAVTEDSILQAKKRLVKDALECTDNEGDAIDYICETLMSRVSNIQENNALLHSFKALCAIGEEQQAWVWLVDEILKLPDVCHK